MNHLIKLMLLVAGMLTMSSNNVLGQGPSTLPKSLNEKSYFNVNIDNFPPAKRKNLLNRGGQPNDERDDTPALQAVINNLHNANGGVITIPEGVWHFGFVNLKSNVHLVFSSKAIVKPLSNPSKRIIFRIGWNNGRSENVSIRSDNGQRFTIDLSDIPSLKKFSVIAVKNASNFQISDFKIVDNATYVSGIDFAGSKIGSSWKVPSKGLIKNISMVNAHGSYGLIQVRSGNKLLFKNLYSTGGVTLRLESDDVSATLGAIPQNVARMTEISAYNIHCTNGSAAVMLQPWGAQNGWVDIQKVFAKSCMTAVRIDRANKNSHSSGIGKFSPNSRITDIKCIYGTQAMVKKGIDQWVPCTLRNNPNILKVQNIWPQAIPFRRGPTVAPLLYRASDNVRSSPRNYSIKVPSPKVLRKKSSGFPSTSLMILRNNHAVNCANCDKGTACNDKDPCTKNDKITINCYCAGTYDCN